ncbi:MAG TPA: hypothetical protein VHM70_12875 [Polyangiaceae bacterium]|jgi:hypothetical protein|nr:hypothetical protein [Polyangiaceae bacterium]
MNDVYLGWVWSRSRLTRTWWIQSGGAALAATLFGLILEHRASPSSSRINTLLTFTLGLILPLLTWATASQLFPNGLFASLAPIATHGASRRGLLLGAGLRALSGATAIVLGSTVVVFLLGGSARAGNFGALLIGTWIAVLGAVAYTAWFLLGSSFGSRAQGRWVFLALDWLLGSSASALALPWPRGHLRNLLGGESVANLEQPAATLTLTLLILVYLGLTCVRTPR